MSLFVLKIIGILSMFIDHYHYIIGGPEILNIIGRMAFPIFSFSLGEGYFHTGNFKKYFQSMEKLDIKKTRKYLEKKEM